MSSTFTPFLFAAVLSAWTVAYGLRQKKKGEHMAAAAVVDGGAAQPRSSLMPEQR